MVWNLNRTEEEVIVASVVTISRTLTSIISTWGTLTIYSRISSEEKIHLLLSLRMMMNSWTNLLVLSVKWASEVACKCTNKWIMVWEIWGDNKSKKEVEIRSQISVRWDKWALLMRTISSEVDLEAVDLAVAWWWALITWEAAEAFLHSNRAVFLVWAVEWESLWASKQW